MHNSAGVPGETCRVGIYRIAPYAVPEALRQETVALLQPTRTIATPDGARRPSPGLWHCGTALEE